MNESQYTTYAPPPGYYAVPVKPPLNPLAVVSLITGLLGMTILPVILGHLAVVRIDKTGERGRSAAIIGLVLGYIQVAVWVVAFWVSLFSS